MLLLQNSKYITNIVRLKLIEAKSIHLWKVNPAGMESNSGRWDRKKS